MIQWLWIPILSGFAYRARGSSWTNSDSGIKGLRVAKLAVGSFPIALAVFLCGANIELSIGVLIVTAAVDSFPHGKSQGASNWGQMVFLWFNSIVSAVPATIALWLSGKENMAVAALSLTPLIVVAYWLGGKLPFQFNIGPLGFHKGPEIGEFLYGLSRTLFVFL